MHDDGVPFNGTVGELQQGSVAVYGLQPPVLIASALDFDSSATVLGVQMEHKPLSTLSTEVISSILVEGRATADQHGAFSGLFPGQTRAMGEGDNDEFYDPQKEYFDASIKIWRGQICVAYLYIWQFLRE